MSQHTQTPITFLSLTTAEQPVQVRLDQIVTVQTHSPSSTLITTTQGLIYVDQSVQTIAEGITRVLGGNTPVTTPPTEGESA